MNITQKEFYGGLFTVVATVLSVAGMGFATDAELQEVEKRAAINVAVLGEYLGLELNEDHTLLKRSHETLDQKLDKNLGVLNQKMDDLYEKVGALDQKVDDLDQKVDALDQKVGDLDEKVGDSDDALIQQIKEAIDESIKKALENR